MEKVGNKIKRVLYKNLSLENYLKVVSSAFFVCYRLGFGRFFSDYEYPSFLKKMISSGDVIIDIGANLGYYSWFFARYSGKEGRVYSVEPMRPILPVLQRNVGRFKQVEILPYALGNEEKTISMVNDTTLLVGYMQTGRNVVQETSQKKHNEDLSFDAEMKKGSELFGALDKLDFIKCDIEGFEVVALSEMETVIRKHLPVVLIETHHENRKHLIDLFEKMNYSAYVLEKKKLRPTNGKEHKDMILIPEHKQEYFEQFQKA